MRLADRTVLVTGGGSGIGQATARRCAVEEATVVVTDVDKDMGSETAAVINESGGEASFCPLDVTNYEAFETIVREVDDEYGLDCLVNNAGVTQTTEFEAMTVEERDRILSVNLLGVWNGCHVAIPHLEKGGAIVNVSSVGALHGFAHAPTYALCKAAVDNLTKSLAATVGDDGIRINAVLPGRVETPLLKSGLDEEADIAALKSEHALERFGQPSEIAACIVFLLSEDASFVTGHGLVADGGSVLRS